MADTTLVVIISVSVAVILLAIGLGLCLCRAYGVFGSKTKTRDMYLDNVTLELKKSFFSLSPVIKSGTHFELMIGSKPKQRLELSHIDSDAVMILQMKSDISSVSKEIYLNSLETLRRLDKHDHVAAFYGTYDTPSGACSVIEFSQFGTLKYYLSYSSYKTFYDYRGFSDDDDTFSNMRSPESINSLQRKRNLFAYPKIVMESRKTPLSALTLYFLMWQICLGMEFLHLRNYIHGSLCSFNVFVTGHLNLKINCFSLAFEDKYALNAIPRWMAPEVFVTKTLTKQADVWSFGVTMWELFNCGAIPYNHLTVDEVVNQTRTGQYKLTPPPGDTSVARLFSECFNLYPHHRPSFSQIRLVLERLLEGSEVALTNKFIDSRRLQYANTELLDKIFFDQQEVDVAREEHAQRPLYFTLPGGGGELSGTPVRTGSISRIPITLTRDTSPQQGDSSLPRGDVTYADPLDFQNGTGTGRNTGATMDLLSTSSAEFDDLSTTESDYDREYNNLESGLLPPQPTRPKVIKMRRVSSLNDLMNFRQALQIRPPGSLDRPNSVLFNEEEFDTRSCSSDEYEDADQLFQDKKEAHSSLKRIGSALHASFRKIRQKGPVKDECGYETLPNKNDSWEKRSFRNLLISSKKWMGSNSKSPVPHKLTRRSYERETSQSETCLLVPPTFNGPVLNSEPPVLNSEPPPCNGASEGSPHMVPTRTVSVSSGISVPLSVYSDYEIPDEVLEASVHLRDTSLQNSPTPLISEPSQSTLSVNHLPISKSRSAHEIWNLDSDRVIVRSRANSQTHTDRSKHASCLIDYSPTSSRSNKVKLKRKGVLSRSFNRSFNRKKYGKSISDILGTPPAVPTDRRPSILCTCCNSVHVCQTLPGMSLTRKATLSSSPSKIYENTRLNVPGNELEPVSNEAESDYETLPGVSSQKTDRPIDYETFSVKHNANEEKKLITKMSTTRKLLSHK
ncbi:uncharacterized protein LOC134821098 [Bolinopsis microptera]|uniref:uncharacterized protein LOC134821098 n=1 Tax=Bolinopsis microptera TaxID=2820187 RepID=UPI00307A5FB0